MHRKYLPLDDGTETQIIEDLRTVAPHVDAPVFAQALVIEAVYLGDLSGFVVSADEGDSVGVADFQGEEEEEGFDGVVAAVYEVAEEEVVFVGAFPADFEEFN